MDIALEALNNFVHYCGLKLSKQVRMEILFL